MDLNNIISKDVKTIISSTSLKESASIMESENIGFLPVVAGRKVIGVLTDRDIVIAIAHDVSVESNVSNIMNKTVHYVYSYDDIGHCISLMSLNQIRRLVVLNELDDLVGVISLGDISKNDLTSDKASNVLKKVSTPKLNYNSTHECYTKVDDFVL